jgi:hypothetical protein
VTAPEASHIALAALPAFTGFLAGSAVWGIWLGRLGGVAAWRRMAIAGMLGFAPATLVVSIGLSVIEPLAIEAADALPVHRVFTILFVPATSLVAGVSAAAIAAGLRRRGPAVPITRDTALAAGAAFLVVNLGMEAIGWVVGGPGAAARSTMITAMLAGLAAAALAGGAVLSMRVEASARTV